MLVDHFADNTVEETRRNTNDDLQKHLYCCGYEKIVQDVFV